MTSNKRTRGWGMAIACLTLAGACAGTPATPEQIKLTKRRFLKPFLQGTKVVCEQLDLDISMIFHLYVSVPGHSERFQRFDKEQKEALVQKTWRNLTGDKRGWFKVKIIEPTELLEPGVAASPGTTYTVMNEFKLRIHERGQPQMSARAHGGIVVVEEAGRSPIQPREYVIADGAVKR